MQQQLIAGDSLAFNVQVPQYPANAGWALAYRLVPRTVGNAVVNINATANGTGYAVAVAAATTAAWAADTYTWASWVNKAGELYTVGGGTILVQPDPRTVAAGYDDRSVEEQQLSQVTATIQARISGGLVAEYTIGSRSLKNESMAALLALRSQLRVTVARQRRGQQIAAGLGRPDRLGVRFS